MVFILMGTHTCLHVFVACCATLLFILVTRAKEKNDERTRT